MKKEQKYINYKGKGNHSVNELENIIEQREEELHLIKSGEAVKNNDLLHNVINCLGFEEMFNGSAYCKKCEQHKLEHL